LAETFESAQLLQTTSDSFQNMSEKFLIKKRPEETLLNSIEFKFGSDIKREL
jgi:hypothetical protein